LRILHRQALVTARRSVRAIDTLVNNAGIFVAKPFTDYTEDEFAATTGVNLAGFFRTTQLVIPHMLAQCGGHIVNITSSLVDNANSNIPSVLASLTKGGRTVRTKSLAIEYAGRGHPRQRSLARHSSRPRCTPRSTTRPSVAAPGRPDGRAERTSSTRSSTSRRPFVTGEILHVDGGRAAAAEIEASVMPLVERRFLMFTERGSSW